MTLKELFGRTLCELRNERYDLSDVKFVVWQMALQ